MSVQTTVASRIVNATPGLLSDINVARVISAALESTTVPFGAVVSRGTAAGQAVAGGDATGILGITVRSVGMEQAAIGDLTLGYTETQAIAILDEGYVFAICVGGCNAGDTVKFVNATGALSAGAAAAGETTITGSTWQEDVAAGEVGKLKLNVVGLVAGS